MSKNHKIQKNRRVLFLFLIFFLSFPLVPIRAADVTPADQTAQKQPLASETPAPSTGDSGEVSVNQAPVSSSPGNVTIDFKDADIQNVLRILSYKSGVNIVAGKDVTGIVTIRLVDVPWEKALDVVLKTYGYAYDHEGGIIRVATIENLKKEELSTEVFVLNYTQAADVEKSLKDVLSDRGKIRSDTRSNTIIVTDMPTVIQNVRKVVEHLDMITSQVVIESKIIETTLGNADRMGIKWNAVASVNGSKRPTTLPFPARQRTRLSQFLPGGKEPQSTESIDADGNETFITTSTADFPQTDAFPIFTKGAGATNLQPTFPVALRTDFAFGTLDFSQFSAILEMIRTRSDSKVLSEPHITTLNNQEAKILVGEKISIPKFERNATSGHMEITGYTDKDLGITLSVTPQVNSQNEIVLNVNPKIETLLRYDTITPDIKAPHYSSREAKTQVRIKSGQTIVIGGLIKEENIETDTKVPLLGDIPLIGKFLFSHKDKSVTKTDLLFFMTVTVVNEKNVPQGHKV